MSAVIVITCWAITRESHVCSPTPESCVGVQLQNSVKRVWVRLETNVSRFDGGYELRSWTKRLKLGGYEENADSCTKFCSMFPLDESWQ